MTFSITARCEKTGQLGVAVSTRVPAVGSLCPFARSGVGAISTQSFVNPYIGVNALKYLEQGLSASEVLEKVLAEDPEPELRQVSIVDKNGKSAAFTGSKSDTWKGHLTGKNYAVAGNMLVGEETIKDMVRTFDENFDSSLAERLVSALEAGQKAGGDKRGRQSAALYIVGTEAFPLLDLRVDEHKDPVTELRRVFEVAKIQLVPFISMLPTKVNPKGKFNFEESRNMGLLQD